jgi:hypothetical protein
MRRGAGSLPRPVGVPPADLEWQVCVTMLRQLADVERRTPAAAGLI